VLIHLHQRKSFSLFTTSQEIGWDESILEMTHFVLSGTLSINSVNQRNSKWLTVAILQPLNLHVSAVSLISTTFCSVIHLSHVNLIVSPTAWPIWTKFGIMMQRGPYTYTGCKIYTRD